MSRSIRDKIKNQKSGYGGTDLRKAFLSATSEPLENAVNLPIQQVYVNPDQPRQVFDVELLEELADDIKNRGVLQPLLVRPIGEDEEGNQTYQIIAGERRRRAAEMAGLSEIPAIIYYVDEQEARFMSLVENIQRAELSPLDEKTYFEGLQAEYNLSIKDIAQLIHKSENYVRNRLNNRLADLTIAKSNEVEIEREALDSENYHKNAQQELLLDNSQYQQKHQPIIQPKYNPGAFKRFSVTLESTALALEKGVDEKAKTSIRENLEELERKIAELKARLGQ